MRITPPNDGPVFHQRLPAGALGLAASHFPASVVVELRGGGYCGGVLVAPAAVLTAAHCRNPSHIWTGLSEHDITGVARVAKRVAHPQLDAALLVLDVAPKVEPAVFRQGEEPAPEELVLATYGGATSDGGAGRTLRHNRFVYAEIGWNCTVADRAEHGCNVGTDAVIKSSFDSCVGDSGGPLFEPWGAGWRVAAIVSRASHGSRRLCGDGGIYLHVDAISGWLRHTLHLNRGLIFRALRRSR